jgi:hypothetical protein
MFRQELHFSAPFCQPFWIPESFSKAVNCSFMFLSACSSFVSIKNYLLQIARGSFFTTCIREIAEVSREGPRVVVRRES